MSGLLGGKTVVTNVGAQISPEHLKVIREAAARSGDSLSSIIRRGTLNEARRILSESGSPESRPTGRTPRAA